MAGNSDLLNNGIASASYIPSVQEKAVCQSFMFHLDLRWNNYHLIWGYLPGLRT